MKRVATASNWNSTKTEDRGLHQKSSAQPAFSCNGKAQQSKKVWRGDSNATNFFLLPVTYKKT